MIDFGYIYYMTIIIDSICTVYTISPHRNPHLYLLYILSASFYVNVVYMDELRGYVVYICLPYLYMETYRVIVWKRLTGMDNVFFQ